MGKRRKFSRGIRPRRGQGNVVLSQVAVHLDEHTTGATADRVWVQVAAEGEFKGYAGGAVAFTFDTRVFEQLIANFRRHPSYQAGADGFGMANVIPWDFHHASEMAPTEGTVPSAGAPAQGWIQELAVRHANGKAELWALTKWLEPARTYIKEGRYQWASVSVVFDAVDARSGDKIGPLLTSVALTNQPFIEGMQKLAAQRFAAERWRNGMYIEAAETPEKALEMIRCMLGMPETAAAADVMAELDKVRTWVATGTTPLGVELDEIIGGLRTILNLPSLSTSEEVFVEVDKLVARLVGDSGVGGGMAPGATPPLPEGTDQLPPTGTPPPPPDMTPAPQLENVHMDMLKVLAEKFGVVAKPEAVMDAVDQLLELRGAAAKNVGLEATAATKIILKQTLEDADVRAKYTPILQAVGVSDPEAALDKIATLISESAQLTEMAPEFASLKKRVAEMDEAIEGEEVEEAVASAGVTASSEHYEGLKVALGHMRKHQPEEFAKRYPADKLAKGRAVLNRGGKPGDAANLTRRITATSTTGTGKPDAAPAGGPQGNGGGTIDVSVYPGPNTIMRTAEFVRASVQGAKDWPWDKVHEHASRLVRSGAVTG